MKIFRNIPVFILLLLIGNFLLEAQENNIIEDGFTRFYYPNGQVSSEGYIENGKPNGYWRTFYVSGVLKSEGKEKIICLIVFGCFIILRVIP